MKLNRQVLNRQVELRFIGASACALFILSIFVPFLQAQWIDGRIPEVFPGPEALWSFKEAYEYGYLGRGVIREEYWFAYYWGRGFSLGLGYWIGSFLIFMFEAQFFTVLFAGLAIFKLKPYLILSSLILNAFTIFCMWFVSYALDSYYEIAFQTGFFLPFCSATLFLVALLESWRLHRKKQSAVTTVAPQP
jgi:hypothetical protein